MLFSATMTKKVAKLQRASLKDPVKVRLQILFCSYSGFDTGLEHSCHPLFRIWIRDHVLVFLPLRPPYGSGISFFLILVRISNFGSQIQPTFSESLLGLITFFWLNILDFLQFLPCLSPQIFFSPASISVHKVKKKILAYGISVCE